MRLEYTRAILGLSWPILVAQLAVLANGVADTVMTGHYSATHLAGVGIGTGIYATVFFSLLGVLQGLSPLIARHYGAGEYPAIGVLVRQGVWVALGLSIVGLLVLSFPRWMLLLAQVPANVLPVAEAYLCVVAWGLPGAMLARVFYAFSPSVHKSRPVMLINLTTLFIKIPLSYALLTGKFGLPEMGGVGCAVGSVVMFWSMLVLALGLLLREPYYHQFTIWRGSWRPEGRVLRNVLRLGVPIAASQLVEVTSFTFIALFLARLGAFVSAAHQIIANLAVVLFMVPLSLGIGTQVLVSQALGAGDPQRARENALAGLRLALSIAVVLTGAILLVSKRLLGLYSSDPEVLAIALSLLPLLVLFHVFDATQGVAVNALRGYHRTLVPTLIYVASLWGIGLFGGWWLTFKGVGVPAIGINVGPQGPFGMWLAAALSLVAAGLALFAYLLRVSRVRA